MTTTTPDRTDGSATQQPWAQPEQSAAGIAAAVRERADEIEAARRVPADLSAEFAKAGLYAMLSPRAYGGLEMAPDAFARTIERIAQADASAAWVAFIGATSGSALAYLPERVAREITASRETMIAGVFAPRGKAVVQGSDFIVNGRWQWGSGTQNAQWILGGCLIERDGELERMPNGAPLSRMVVVRSSEVEFLDTWQVSGLCGTGSTDFAMKNVRVPVERSVGLAIDRPLDRPLYRFPQFTLLALGIAAVAMGTARNAIEELIDFAGGKKPQGSSRSLAARSRTQSDVAEAEGFLRSARSFYYETVAAAWKAANDDGEVPVAMRRDMRLATTHAVRSAVRAVDLVYNLGGGTSVYKTSRLQRCFRDIHVATQHMMVAPATLELTGRLFLGLDTETWAL